ncbi:hypothetical protein BGZ70_002088, partial [Mortierella alpina]
MKFCLSSIAGSAIVLTLTAQFAHSSESNARSRDSLSEPSKLISHEVIKANVAQSPPEDKGVSPATVKSSNDHTFHMDILDIDEYEDEDDGALDEGDYDFDEDDEDEEEDDEDEGDHDYDDEEDDRDVTVDLDLNGDTHDPEGQPESAPEDNSDTARPRHPSSDRGFHYADPLMIPPTDQEQCHLLHKRDETPSEPASILQDPSSSSAAAGSDKEAQLTALANFEPGGACIDSFVNFALRFKERCTISCLKTMAHIFAKPDVLGLIGCFGCINFLISGISAVITDCVGLFAPFPKPPSTTIKSVPTGTVRKINLADQAVLASESLPIAVHPDDQGLGTLDFKQVIQSLQNIDLNQVQEWLDIGKRIVQSEAPAAATKDPKVESELAKAPHPEQNGRADEEAIDKEMFNKFIITAGSFVNVKKKSRGLGTPVQPQAADIPAKAVKGSKSKKMSASASRYPLEVSPAPEYVAHRIALFDQLKEQADKIAA